MVTVRWFPRAIAVAIAVLSLVCPLRDVVACAGARACAAAPCCVAKAHGCPMHLLRGVSSDARPHHAAIEDEEDSPCARERSFSRRCCLSLPPLPSRAAD